MKDKKILEALEACISEDIYIPQVMRDEKAKRKMKGSKIRRNGEPVVDAKLTPKFWKDVDKVVHLTKEDCERILNDPEMPSSLKKGLIYSMDKFANANSNRAVRINLSHLLDHAIDGKEFDINKVKMESSEEDQDV